MSEMTRSEYKKCIEELQRIRQIIKGGYRTVGELSKDESASKAYKLSIDLEVALDKMVAPWED